MEYEEQYDKDGDLIYDLLMIIQGKMPIVHRDEIIKMATERAARRGK